MKTALLILIGVFVLPPIAATDPPDSSDFGLNYKQFHKMLEEEGLGFLPLNKHSNDHYSTMLHNGDIFMELFGAKNRVKAVETTIRLNPEVQFKSYIVMRIMLLVALGEYSKPGEKWAFEEMKNLVARGKIQTKMRGAYLTLYSIPKIKAFMFSVDIEKQ